MKKYIRSMLVFGSLVIIPALQTTAQENQKPIKTTPKLVVGIVVDQMRYDYLTRFWDHYGDGGFKRLVNEGFNCKNNHFNYAPTSTGPGHTSIYTGTTPSTHGVIGNNWYDKTSGKIVYCASDENYVSVGTSAGTGKMSPHRMTVSTVTDELRLFTQKRGKVIALALKDRGAVLPGGHMANAAYWYNGGAEGDWISSSYYMDELPRWVVNFNSSDAVEKYKKPWTTLKNISTYLESGADNNVYEGMFAGETAPVFPHNLPEIWENNGQFDLLRGTAYGNSLTTDFALAAIDGEDLGKDAIPDFLAVSYSSTDYVGHQFGVNSKEVQDTYLRLDQDLERLLEFLDRKVGEGEYLVFLSSDHGAVDVPAYLKDQKIPAGYMDSQGMSAKFKEFMSYTYGDADVIKNYSNAQFFLDHDVIRNLDLEVKDVQYKIGQELLSYDGISRVFTGYQMEHNEYSKGIPYIIQNGYNQKRSGDILLVLNPGVVYYPETGSTHGSPYPYDTHVPLLFYGKGIPQGSTVERTEIDDIAPTISALLGIAFPSGTSGQPIEEVLD
ncbi:MAG: alkaline phosphatase family protein [Flavobacteriaceae bacterium]|nr:alkaline phosphatase family protein [Muriicola sp.]MBT8289901.1 alkaline phosphatase family protein [Muriicola sp.]NNC62037.1 alkaline phosphatase family protein [Eudoraea sp.]NNK35093.1 alkaline phosphatase family protein [Eudoraea sp.]NNL39317.1 alkaline phosphatase family protein [Flavobacteriaceae bacterium]